MFLIDIALRNMYTIWFWIMTQCEPEYRCTYRGADLTVNDLRFSLKDWNKLLLAVSPQNPDGGRVETDETHQNGKNIHIENAESSVECRTAWDFIFPKEFFGISDSLIVCSGWVRNLLMRLQSITMSAVVSTYSHKRLVTRVLECYK